jgi:hypothetical protein
MELKLAKLPDRTPVKIAITVPPELNRKLVLYTELYNTRYAGSEETIADLIPYMLADFLEADKNFAKAFKEHEVGPPAERVQLAQRTRRQRVVSTNEPSAQSTLEE